MLRIDVRVLVRAAWLVPCAGALTGALVAQAPAPNTDRPPVMPTLDARVTYQMNASGKSQAITVEFGGHGDKLRIDNPVAPGDLVFDRHANTLTVVMQQPRAYMTIPIKNNGQNPFLLDTDQQFERLPTTRVVAGLTCQDWRVTSPKGEATACVTSDGLLLAQSGADPSGTRGTLVATNVSVSPIPASDFQPPAGFTRVAHPGP